MQEPDTTGYFEKRADEERIAAAQAGDERAAQCHRDLAERYAALASGPQPDDGAEPPQGPGILRNEFRILP